MKETNGIITVKLNEAPHPPLPLPFQKRKRKRDCLNNRYLLSGTVVKTIG